MLDLTEQRKPLPRKTLFGIGRRRDRGGLPPLLDPSNPTATVKPEHLVDSTAVQKANGNLPSPSTSEYNNLVNEIYRVYNASREAYEVSRQRWNLYQRYYDGDQWVAIDENHGLMDVRASNEDIERCNGLNQTTYIIQRLTSYATQNDPQVQPLALMDTPLHQKAAWEADGLAGKLYREHSLRRLREKQVINALVTTSSYRYWMWNPNKTDLVADLDPYTGEVIGATSAPVGGLDLRVLRGPDVFWDAAAECMEDAAQCVIRTIKPLTWIQQTYGKVGYSVEPDTTANCGDIALSYMDDSGNVQGGKRTDKRDAAMLLEWLVLPQPGGRYPNGLYVVMANRKLLYKSDWPWADKERFPMSELTWMDREGSPYGFSLVEFLAEPQGIINREYSRILARLDKDKRMVFVQKLSGIGPNDIEELRDMYKVYYNAGTNPPGVTNMPPINDQHFRAIEDATKYMEKVSGLVDVLRGDMPMSQMSGVLYDIMLETATTTLAPFMQRIGQNEVDFLRGAISEYTDKGSPQILLGLDTRGNKTVRQGTSAYGESALDALTDGGKVELYLNPTNGLLKSPAGQQKEIDEKYQMGMFGDPASPEARRIYWSLSDNSLAQKVLAMLDEQEQMAAQSPPPDPVEMQMQIDDNKEEARLEREMELLRMKHNLALQKAQSDAHIQAALGDAEDEAEQSKLSVQAQMDSQVKDSESRSALSVAAQSHQQEMEKLMAAHALEMGKLQMEHGHKTQLAREQMKHTGMIADKQLKQQTMLAKMKPKPAAKSTPTKK